MMSIPKLRRLPVTREDLQGVVLPTPPNLTPYPYQRRFNQEEYRLLKLGLIEEDVAYVEDGWAYYFDRHGPHIFPYKLRLIEDGLEAVGTELWADPQLPVAPNTTALTGIIQAIRRREYPANLAFYRRRKPELMSQSNSYPMDLELSKQDLWKLAWGFIPSSMDDHWMSWFDFEAQILHVHWYWKPHHLYQIRFEGYNEGYRAVEVKIATDLEGDLFNPPHAASMVGVFVSWCPYRFEEA